MKAKANTAPAKAAETPRNTTRQRRSRVSPP